MAQPTNIKIKIKCLKSDDFEISIDSEASVDDLKEEIVRIRNIDPAKQRLIYKGRVLKSDKKLKDYKISDETTIHLIVRKQAVTNPRNDEPTQQNSTNRNNNNNPIPTGTTAISVAVVDGSNGAADVNSILNSVLSGFSNGNLNQQSLQNQIQSAMANNPAHVMNLRGLLNPGDNPNVTNDDDVSSIDGDENENDNNTSTNNSNNNSGINRVLPDQLQPQFAVSNGRGGYSPVTLLPPVLRSCNAINLELGRLQRNYNRNVMGIGDDNEEDEKKEENDTTQSSMNIDMDNNVQVEMEVQTIVADGNGNVLSNNILPIPQSQAQAQHVRLNNISQASADTTAQEEQKTAPRAASAAAAPPRRREYLSNLLDTWDRFNEVVFGMPSFENADEDEDEEMKGNNNDEDIEYKGVMGFIDSVFDELIDYQNTIESGLNNEIIDQEAKEEKEQKEEKRDIDIDEDNDMEMKGNDNDDDGNGNGDDEEDSLKGYRKEKKDVLKKKVGSAGNMLVEIGTVLASLGHMINKMDLHRKTTRNRLRITGLTGISHVVRTAVPVEISTIVSRGINLGQQFQHMRQMANTQPSQPAQPSQPQPNPQSPPQSQSQPSQPQPVANNNNNDDGVTQANSQQNANANTRPPPVSNGNSTNTTTNINTANTSNNNNNGQSSLLSSLLDSFAGSNQNENNDNNDNSPNMEIDNDNNNNTNTSTNTTQNAPNNSNNSNTNPMGALLNAFTGNNNNNTARGGTSNPLASLMSAFTGARANRNTNNNRNDNNNNDRNPLMLINRTLKFMIDTLSMSELNQVRNGNYTFIRNYKNILSSFILNSILGGNDTPMRRHEIAMDYANGFGLFIISQFSSERRDVIRSLTLTHFRNNTPLLIDIILDSNNEIIFEEKITDWISCVYSSWIYKLSLQYRNRIEDVKELFIQILINASKYLYRNNNNNNNILNNLQLIPSFVGYFVDIAKSYHLKEMAKQHGAETNNNGNDGSNTSNKLKRINKKQYGTEQWVMNVEESERNRWLETIKCDQKRMKHSLSQMKAHKFSDSYLPPNSAVNENKKKGIFKKNKDEEKNDRK